MNKPGFYSVVQFIPDVERGEAVNVGVVVGAPTLGMRVRMAERNEYVKQWFGAQGYDDTRLGFAKSALAKRLEDVAPDADALAMFRAQESGQLQLTPPRPMVVANLDDASVSLFLRLVSDPELQRREPRSPKPDLAPIVRGLVRKNVPIQRRLEVNVPISGEALKTDFAFRNGARNLVKAVGLSGRRETAIEEASEYGSKGLLIAKHPDPAIGASKLVLVADIEDQPLADRIARLLHDHDVRFVAASELPSFAAEIEREAH